MSTNLRRGGWSDGEPEPVHELEATFVDDYEDFQAAAVTIFDPDCELAPENWLTAEAALVVGLEEMR